MNDKIFKAYDIRGIFPDELNEETAYKIGRAFVSFLGVEKPKVVVGMDNRLSSGVLSVALEKGITEQGGDVIEIGFCTSPMFYFAAAKFNYDGGLMVTASHNPKEYNGFKMVNKGGIPISEATGIKQIKDLVLANDFKTSAALGNKEKKDVLPDYVAAFQSPEDFNLTVVADTANSSSGVPVSKMLNKTALIHIFDELDGNFSNHEPNPQKKENLRDLQSAVKIAEADLGVAFDGDGDRIVFIDEQSQIVSANSVLSLMASIILKKKGKQKIAYDLRCSNIVPETIKSWGGIPVLTQVGHSVIKEKMREEQVIFGGEISGHYYYKEEFYNEAPFFVLFSILSEMKKTKKPLSNLIAPFQKYFHSEELNFAVDNSAEKIKALKEKYSQEKYSQEKPGQEKAKVLEIDGLRIDFEDWWFLVRPSNTEPVLRLIVEAKTHFLMDEKTKELSELIKK